MRLHVLAQSVPKALFQRDLPNEQIHALYRTFTISVTSDFMFCESNRKSEKKYSSILRL